MLGKADIRLIQTASDQLTDGGRPLLAMLARPISSVKEWAIELGHILAVHDENERLRQENSRLLAWKARAVRLEVQNRFLSEIIKLPTTSIATRSISARIVADSSPAFVQSRLLDVGLEQGVEEGMAVVDANGLVGRILHTSANSSRLLLLTDYTSRIPVLVGANGEQAIMEGDNTAFPTLKFLPLNPSVQMGDEVITSGVGGILPAGIPVGQLVDLPNNGIRIRSYVDWTRLNYVSIVNGSRIAQPDLVPRDGAS